MKKRKGVQSEGEAFYRPSKCGPLRPLFSELMRRQYYVVGLMKEHMKED